MFTSRKMPPGSPAERGAREGAGEERVAIFIDGSNLYHALETTFHRHNLNFTEFSNKLCGSRHLFRTYYYNILQEPSQWPDAYRDQQEFLSVLRMTPYMEVRLGGTKMGQGVQVEKGIDIMIATDMLFFAWNDFYDVAVLVSGDADFAYALQTVKNMGKYVEVAYFRSGISKDLLDVADNRHLLDRDFFNGLWVGGERARRRRSGGEQKPRHMPTREAPPVILESTPPPPPPPQPPPTTTLPTPMY